MNKKHLIRYKDSHGFKDLYFYEDGIYEVKFVNGSERYCVTQERGEEIFKYYYNLNNNI